MKNFFFILLALFALSISSCKKEKTDPNQLYITFDADGVNTEYKSTQYVYHSGAGGGVYVDGGFFDLDKEISLGITMDQDSIVGADLTGLIGKKIGFEGCAGSGCGTTADMDYSLGIGGDSWLPQYTTNALPNQYLKITGVEFYQTVNVFGHVDKLYKVTGEFTVNVSDGTTVKKLTNGKFKLIFPEETD